MFKLNTFIHKTSFWVKAGLFLFILVPVPLIHQAQEQPQRIQILDPDTGQPVSHVHFLYGNQKGISGEEGYLLLHYRERETLYISHISYGKQSFLSKAVQKALQEGVLYLDTQSNTALQPVTVIALRPKVYDQEIIPLSCQDKLSHDAGASLGQIPAISGIRKSGSYGFDPVLRGFKYDQLNIVIDGVQSAAAACPNRMDPPVSQVSLNLMDRVEIFKGPYSLRYGNALGGTINFVSSAAVFSESFEPAGRVSGSYESNGNIYRTEGLIGIREKKYTLHLLGAWSHGNDYRDGEGIDIPSDFQRSSLGAKIAIRLTTKQNLTFSATNNIAKDVDFPSLPMDLRKDNTWLYQAGHTIKRNGRVLTAWTTSAYASLVDHKMDNLLKILDPRMVNAETPAKTQTYGARTEARLNFGKNRLYTGTDIRVEKASGTRTREFLMGPNAGSVFEDNVWQDGKISRAGIFGEYHLTMDTYRWVFSGRLELNRSEINDPAGEFIANYSQTSSSQVNPGISIGVTRDLSRIFSAGLWLGRTQRSGSLTERFINYFPVGLDPYELLGNPRLDPEVNNQADLNLKWQSTTYDIQLNLFASFLQDFISSEIREDLNPRMPGSPGVRQFVNIEKALMTGFELLWQQQLPFHLQHELSMAFTYGRDKIRDEPLPEIPPLDLRFQLGGNFLKHTFRPEIMFWHVWQQERVAASFGETQTPAFTVVDLRVAYKLSRIFTLATGVQNLFDQAYYEHLSRSVRGNIPRPVYSPGRNFYLTLGIDLMNHE